MPWIMLHKKMINKWEYGELTVGERLMFIHMLLIADSVRNRFPVDTKWLHRKLQVKAPLKLEKFEKLGFIEFFGSEKKIDRSVIREDINLKDINLKEKICGDLDENLLWGKCVFQIECQILPDNFKSLFETMVFGGISDGNANFICQNKFHADCISKNYTELIETTMGEIFGFSLEAKFIVEERQ